MKLIIEISAEKYEWFKKNIKNPNKNGTVGAVALGIPYEDRQQGEWTPVSEGLPRRNGVYNVTRIIEGTAISDSCYFDGQNTWHRDTGVNHGRPYLNDIIAWQELPEPYKEGDQE